MASKLRYDNRSSATKSGLTKLLATVDQRNEALSCSCWLKLLSCFSCSCGDSHLTV